MTERLRLTCQGNDYWMLWDGDIYIGTVVITNGRLDFRLDHDLTIVSTYGETDSVLGYVDLDADRERCPACNMPLWRDEEGDWNHVITDEDGNPIALTLVCNPREETR
jgi:hypothetical protein